MKKILQMMFALGLTVVPSTLGTVKKASVNESKYENFIQSWNEFLYYRYDMSSSETDYVKKNIKSIVKDNLGDDPLFIDIFKDANIKFLSLVGDQLKVQFSNKKNKSIISEDIIKSFTLILYNYDNIDKFIKNTQDYLKLYPMIIDKNNYIQLEIEDKLKARYQNFIDWYSFELLYLNNINEFYDFLDFDAIKTTLESKNYIKADYLCSTNLKFYFRRDIKSLRNSEDKKIFFSKDKSVMTFNILKWLSKHTYLNPYDKDCANFFSIESIDYKKGYTTITLNKKYFDKSLIITLNEK
ncbi:hypothetical protein SCORR_v1c01940 [Spiroplasma corruscae]|uniref:Uncharacterized protein n=1 Tax=Spiroplasma corruscae TaxID=216934 RepID=A0A222ENA2_9MOLU|nr:hypothetical protein [Spiroplasma corruscae]ASP27969.1 hypothetical protein SCORR_v1c01940 [Spiroplasma corruscae]